MAVVTNLTIGTSTKMSVNYQSHEISVTVSYELERQDSDLMKLVEEKAAEVEKAHRSIWRRIRDLRAQEKSEDASTPAATTEAEPLQAAEECSNGETGPPVTPPEGASSPSGNNGALYKEAPASEAMITAPQRRAIEALAGRAQITDEELRRRMQARFGKSEVEDLTKRQASMLLAELQRSEREHERVSAP